MKRFVTAVFSHETNTFSSIQTPLKSFGRFSGGNGPVSGDAAISAYRGTNMPVAAYIDLAEEAGAELNFAIAAQATPSGCAEDTVLEHVAEAVCDAVRDGCDALFLDLHGGMVTLGFDDPEGELLSRVRAIAPDLPICVAFDFHTNMSKA
ncbi:MAG: ABC transporter substrate-binding protein, partial [Rhodospirillaceae bacterium]|nr:ABC transporter substrate-binding protein [Rhodospirillaceae bacterium]